jgi:hypothetical protein
MASHPALGWAAVACATVLFRRSRCPRRSLAPLSSEWLSDIKRQKMRGGEY